MDTIRVVLVDDHPVVRTGIRNVLEAAGIKVAAEAGNGEDALRLVDSLQPDVLLLDIRMPGLSGVEVARRLQPRRPPLPILVLSAYDYDGYVFELLEAGATGYVLKEEALDTIVMAVRAAVQGEPWLSPRVVAKLMVQTHWRKDNPQPTLSVRELEVLRLMATGLDNQHIAEKLCLTERTVKYHVCNIYDKLGVSSRIEAVLYAVRQGFVDK